MTFLSFSRRAFGAIRFFALLLALLSPTVGVAETKSYGVWIKTSDIGGAGTDADVHITLYGTQSKDGTEKKLVQHSGRNFKAGELEFFTVLVDETVGELEQIKLEHDNGGPGPAWHVEWVQVFDVAYNNRPVLFDIERWLKDDHGFQTHVTVQRFDFESWKADFASRMPAPEGDWTFACGGLNCTTKISQSYSSTDSKSTTWSNTAKVSVTLSYTKRTVNPETASFDEYQASVTAEDSFTKTRTIANSTTFGYKEECGINPDPEKFLIDSVWQWTATTKMQGIPVTIKTCEAVCTPTGAPPRFAAGDIRTIDSCFVTRDFAFVPNEAIDGHNTEIHEAVSVTRCQRMCKDREWCKSFDYRKADGQCYLQNVSDNDVPLKNDYEGDPYDHYYMIARRSQPVQEK